MIVSGITAAGPGNGNYTVTQQTGLIANITGNGSATTPTPPFDPRLIPPGSEPIYRLPDFEPPMDSTEFSNVQIKPSQYVETDNQWRDIPFWDLFGNEKAKKILTDVRVIEGVVYVIDGADVMNLLRMGDSMRVSFKRKQTENTRQEISDLSPVSSEAMPAPEARVLKPATPVVMRQLKDGTRYGTLKNPGKNVFVRILGGDWTSAKDGMVILPGDEVKTALTESSVEVLIEGGKIGHVEIKEGSLFRIAKAEVDAKTGDTTTLLDLAIGKILVKVEALKGNSKFEVKSPTALTGVRGTIFEVTVKEKA